VAIERGTRLFRTLFISDVHLGARGCQADRLLDFLRYHDAETIYLVGDIVDGWQLRSGWYWPQPHNDVVQKLLRKARKGARLIYLPGNHDEFLRDYYGTHFGGIEVVETPSTRPPTGAVISSCMATCSTWSSSMRAGSRSWAIPPTNSPS
jgi:UDP-2,3-diacylglucosamine pyrophosphatase LpxH